MLISASELEAEIKEVEGIEVLIHPKTKDEKFPSYKATYGRGLSDDRLVKALKRRLHVSTNGASFSIMRRDGVKSVYPYVKLGQIRATQPQAA
jgi:hypothetical protein